MLVIQATYRLRTLGGLSFDRHDGSAVPEFRTRWLAVMTVIGAGGGRGVARDRLLGLFWPEVPADRGRHGLSQVLYGVHRRLGAEIMLSDGPALRFDPAQVSVDLIDFEAALAADRWPAALDLYTGPFADAFYLDGAPEFERWVEDQRARLAHLVEDAAETAARAEEQGGRLGPARDLWRRLCRLDPFNSRYALEYVTALAKSGDRGGAVRHGRAHVDLLARELGTAPPTRLLDFLERLQRGTFVSAPDERRQG